MNQEKDAENGAAAQLPVKPRRVIGRPFQKGVSANPGGRPKGELEVRALAQQHGVEAIVAMVNMARDPEIPPPVRILAWDKVLDRGYGRPAQSLGLGEGGGKLTPRRVIIELEDGQGG